MYTESEEVKVETRNGITVSQTATLEYMIHLFKRFVGSNTYVTVETQLQSSLAPAFSTVYLQVYNRSTLAWETLSSDSQSPALSDFELFGVIEDTANYKNSSNVISCRIYQLAL